MTVERQASTRGSAPGGSENGCQDPELRARIFSWMDRAEAEGALRNIKGSGQSCDSGHTSSDANRESSWVSSSGRTPSGWEGDPPSSPRRGSRQEGASCDEPSRPSLDRHRPSLDLIRTLSSPEMVPSQLAASVPRLSRIAVSDWASEQWFIPHKDLSVDTTCEYQKISSSEVGCTWKGSLNPRVVEEDGVERTRMQPVAVKQVFMDEYSKVNLPFAFFSLLRFALVLEGTWYHLSQENMHAPCPILAPEALAPMLLERDMPWIPLGRVRFSFSAVCLLATPWKRDLTCCPWVFPPAAPRPRFEGADVCYL
jgi:hypothetical protein